MTISWRALGFIGLLGGAGGTIWGSLVGFGVWKSQQVARPS